MTGEPGDRKLDVPTPNREKADEEEGEEYLGQYIPFQRATDFIIYDSIFLSSEPPTSIIIFKK